jgi:hypothetical protein
MRTTSRLLPLGVLWAFSLSCKARTFNAQVKNAENGEVNAARSGGALGLNACVDRLLTWETQANAAGARDNAEFDVESFEIPLDVLKSDRTARGFEAEMASLEFERDGKRWVRWLINPDDTKWTPEVEKWMLSKNFDTTRQKYFKGRRTSSRSFFIQDPGTGALFSLKNSTNRTGGKWSDKKQTWKDAQEIRLTNEFARRVTDHIQLRHVVIIPEPVAYGIEAIDQAQVVRSYGTLEKCRKNYLPGFSALHEATGREIAEKNGSQDPYAYWTENYIVPASRAIAELQVHFGMTLDSPHSQNFLVELDEQLKPTGRIAVRDFVDSNISQDYLSRVGATELLNAWPNDSTLEGQLSPYFGPLHGNEPPSWAKGRTDDWAGKFCNEFASTMSEITGVSVSAFPITKCEKGSYVGWTQPFAMGKAFKPWLDKARCFVGPRYVAQQNACDEKAMRKFK